MNIVIIVPSTAREYAKELTGTTETIVNEDGTESTTVTPSGLFEAEYVDGEGHKFYVSSGEFYSGELNTLLNSECEHFVFFGTPEEALGVKGLTKNEPITE